MCKSDSPSGVCLGVEETEMWKGKHLWGFITLGLNTGHAFWSFAKGSLSPKTSCQEVFKKWKTNNKKEKEEAKGEKENYFRVLKVYLNQSKSLFHVD